jgi:MFS family permease
MPAPKPEPASKPRGLRPLWAATAASSLGDGAYLAAAPLLAATLTQSPVAVSLVTTATLTPWFLIGPFAGALVDRWQRRTVMILADLVRAACVLALAVLVLTDLASIAALAIVGFVLTSGQSFHNAAAQAIIPSLTGRDRAALASANSRIATTESVAAGFVGPPLGSALFSISPWLPIAADATSFAASAALLRAVPAPPPPQRNGIGIFASVAQATRWMFRHRQLLELALLIAGGNLATNAAMATFVLYAHQDLGVTTWGFGLLLAVQAIGATLGGWAATRMSKRMTFRAMLPIAQVGRALAFVALAFTTSPYVAGVCMAVIGASFTVGTVAAVSARQQLVPDDMLGRVVNVFRLIGNGAAPIGAAIGGIIAARNSLSTPILAAGVFTLGVAALSLLPQFRPPATPEPATQAVAQR